MTTPDPLPLPTAHGPWAAFVDERCATALRRARDQLAGLLARGQEPMSVLAPMAVLEQWNDLTTALRNASALSSLMSQVHPDAAVRTVAEGRQREVSKLSTELRLNRELFDVFTRVEDGDDRIDELDADELDADAARLLRLTLRDFRRAGVDRDEPTRVRLQHLAERETEIDQEFSRAVREDVRSIRIPPERLDGLPADYIAAHPPGDDGLVTITTDYPDVIPFRTFARDAAARRDLVVQFLDRGWPDNDARLRELMAVRHERATTLGYPNWADYDAHEKMIGTGARIGEFIDRIADAAQASAQRDYVELLSRLRLDRPEADAVDAADTAFYTETLRRERYGVDAQEVRRYLDFATVRAGLLDVTGRLFDVQYRPVPDAPSWHPDVTVYDVLRDGRRLGRVYLDLHPREGKYKHAAQFDLLAGLSRRQLPEGVLVCNFSAGLMEHDEVVTLFHEFGHLLHHVLGGHQRWQRFSGVATEWDFVEAPSQMLEEWAWDADVLRSFALDSAGTPIPADLVAGMRAADEFGRGVTTRTQTFYAALSYAIHLGPVDDLTDLVDRMQRTYSLFGYLPGTHFHASFEHLVGYGSAYYTYLWSSVIAQDMFSAFDPLDLMATEPATRYRDRVLVPGGSEDAADLVSDFLGRPYGFAAFRAWLEGRG